MNIIKLWLTVLYGTWCTYTGCIIQPISIDFERGFRCVTTPSHINVWRPRNHIHGLPYILYGEGVVTQRNPRSKSIEIGCNKGI